jgi:hypothetical protein
MKRGAAVVAASTRMSGETEGTMGSWALVLAISLLVLFGLVMIVAARRDSRPLGVDGYVTGGDADGDAGHHHGGGHHGGGDFGGGHHGGGDFGGGGGGGGGHH